MGRDADARGMVLDGVAGHGKSVHQRPDARSDQRNGAKSRMLQSAAVSARSLSVWQLGEQRMRSPRAAFRLSRAPQEYRRDSNAEYGKCSDYGPIHPGQRTERGRRFDALALAKLDNA
jgi:hypothetical protein